MLKKEKNERNKQIVQPVKVNDVSVEIVSEYNYLGTVVDNQFNWNSNTLM